MDKDFIENNYYEFLNFKDLKSETQNSLNEFCNYYLETYKGTNNDNLESLRLFFSKFLKDNHKDSIFVSVFNDTLIINVYDFKIDFVKINDALESLKTFITDFKNFLND